MNISLENTDKLNAVLSMKVEQADYQEKVGEVLKDYRRKAKVDGFRPGKVPMGIRLLSRSPRSDASTGLA